MPPPAAVAQGKIKQQVFDQLSWDNRLSTSNIEVLVTGDKVRLSGTVPSFAARQLAEQDVAAVPGVTAVENELAVKYPAGAETIDDRRIAENIRSLLRLNASIDEGRIAVDVTAGTVILEGTVDSFWQKVKAEALAADVKGVSGMYNKITVVPTKNVIDEVIAEDIEAALDRSLSFNINQVNVTVANGVVTLSGTVPDPVAYHAAMEIAQHTNGVTGINNNLKVVYLPSD